MTRLTPDPPTVGPDKSSEFGNGRSESTSSLTEQVIHVVEGALEGLLDVWRDRHGIIIADLSVEKLPPDQARVVGSVLVPSQAASLERAVKAALSASGLGPDQASFQVVVRTNLPDAVSWVRPKGRWLDVMASPGSAAALTTQWYRDEPPIRELDRAEDWIAIELADRTVGWVPDGAVESEGLDRVPPSVRAWRTGWSGWAGEAEGGAWEAAMTPWIGSPYLLGGRKRDGVDCSGLTQRVIAQVLGMGLPRHSKDQVRFGQRVSRFELAPGDLIYATHGERGLSHVALVVSRDGDGFLRVGHAGLDHGHVLIEPIDEFLARYVFRAARRFPSGFQPPDASGERGNGSHPSKQARQ